MNYAHITVDVVMYLSFLFDANEFGVSAQDLELLAWVSESVVRDGCDGDTAASPETLLVYAAALMRRVIVTKRDTQADTKEDTPPTTCVQLFLACVHLAEKMLDDVPYGIAAYAERFDEPIELMIDVEVKLLKLMKFNCHVCHREFTQTATDIAT